MKIKYNGKVIRNRVGSNQYKTRSKKDIGLHLAFLLGLIFFFTCGNTYYEFSKFPPKAHAEIISPLATSQPVESSPSARLVNPDLQKEEKPSHYDSIKKEIYEVFGVHADKAMKVLSCENASLNPEAVNTAGNSPEGSRDMGVFQINEYWQKVNGKFLLDPSINIRIAHKIFTDNGNSFERWTCGRKFGI